MSELPPLEHNPDEYLAALETFMDQTSAATAAQAQQLCEFGPLLDDRYAAVLRDETAANVAAIREYVLSLATCGLRFAVSHPGGISPLTSIGLNPYTGKYVVWIPTAAGKQGYVPLDSEHRLVLNPRFASEQPQRTANLTELTDNMPFPAAGQYGLQLAGG